MSTDEHGESGRSYVYRWHVLRRAYFRQKPCCEQCGAPSTQVRHKDGAQPGDKTFLDWNNLRSVCDRCHDRG